MNIIRSIIPILLSIIEMVINNLSGKMDYVEFQKQLANVNAGIFLTQSPVKN